MLRERKYTEVFSGEELDPVAGSIPGADTSVVEQVVAALTSTYGVREEDFASAELALVPAARPADVGLDRGLVGSAGQDDRLSSYCAVRAILDLSGAPKKTALAYLRTSRRRLRQQHRRQVAVLQQRPGPARGRERGAKYTDLDLRETLRRSEVISADVNDGSIRSSRRRATHQRGAPRLRRDDQALRRGL
jgi:aspartyl aminopeptidase